MDRASQAVCPLGNVWPGLTKYGSRAAVFRLPAVRQDRLNGKFARHFSMRLSAHPVGQYIQLQRGVDRVEVFIVFSDASKVGVRAGLNMQKGPHSAGGEVMRFPKALSDCTANQYDFETRSFRGSFAYY